MPKSRKWLAKKLAGVIREIEVMVCGADLSASDRKQIEYQIRLYTYGCHKTLSYHGPRDQRLCKISCCLSSVYSVYSVNSAVTIP